MKGSGETIFFKNLFNDNIQGVVSLCRFKQRSQRPHQTFGLVCVALLTAIAEAIYLILLCLMTQHAAQYYYSYSNFVLSRSVLQQNPTP